MDNDDRDAERATLEAELRDVELQIERIHDEVRSTSDDLRESDEAGSSRIAVEQLILIESLERRRAELRSQLSGTDARDAIDNPAPRAGSPAPRGDELAQTADVDDQVDALTVGAMSAATEDNPNSDPTELVGAHHTFRLGRRVRPDDPAPEPERARVGMGGRVTRWRASCSGPRVPRCAAIRPAGRRR